MDSFEHNLEMLMNITEERLAEANKDMNIEQISKLFDKVSLILLCNGYDDALNYIIGYINYL